MIMTMKGQVCVVTGASRGIGRGIALQLCQAGATVYITGRHLDTLRATAQEAQSLGGRCVPVVCDSSQESEVKSLFEQVDREQQGRLDVLVNNAYAGVQCDKLAADCAHELRRHGVSYVSLWPGLVQTEMVKEYVAKEEQPEDPLFKKMKSVLSSAETTEMSGKCVVALATDPNILSLSGKVLPSCDLARRYGLKDVDGRPVQDYFSLGYALSQVSSLRWLASYLPGFLRVPKWIVTLYTSKF
ncbi:dehydrogenase/reductase SDR family member 1 isoform X2 [Rattus norvegicus]|uniref:dehydrogenase/reductase SDR family member 1 isoform X2 n=1 Tax=Rattus norvegicus TaxID=10116 RepID=UPI00191703CC|nr:dehydrogenase/reductase SDR family member 1 isoform X3 [Rattus norvegicus]